MDKHVEPMDKLDTDIATRIANALSEILGEQVSSFLLAVDTKKATSVYLKTDIRMAHCMASYLQAAVVQMELSRKSSRYEEA